MVFITRRQSVKLYALYARKYAGGAFRLVARTICCTDEQARLTGARLLQSADAVDIWADHKRVSLLRQNDVERRLSLALQEQAA
jgi:hypothetical protein